MCISHYPCFTAVFFSMDRVGGRCQSQLQIGPLHGVVFPYSFLALSDSFTFEPTEWITRRQPAMIDGRWSANVAQYFNFCLGCGAPEVDQSSVAQCGASVHPQCPFWRPKHKFPAHTTSPTGVSENKLCSVTQTKLIMRQNTLDRMLLF